MAWNEPVGLDFRDRNNQPILDSINYTDDEMSVTSEEYNDERPEITNRNNEIDDSLYEHNESVNTDSTTPIQIAGVSENIETPPISNNTNEKSEPPTDNEENYSEKHVRESADVMENEGNNYENE